MKGAVHIRTWKAPANRRGLENNTGEHEKTSDTDKDARKYKPGTEPAIQE
jgi:hypothetical protein